MSFGRRLALFLVLLVIVPVLALLSILVFVSEDSRQGKADARLAAGVETAIAIYGEDVSKGRAEARRLASMPAIVSALEPGDRGELEAIARRAVGSGTTAVRMLDATGRKVASAGTPQAIAFGEVRVAGLSGELGTVRASATTAARYAAAVKRLSDRELVVSRGDEVLGSTVTPPRSLPPPDETLDIELKEGDYRGREQLLDRESDEAILLLGPRKEGGLLALGKPATILLALFLVLAVAAAWVLARTLARLHAQVSELAATDPLTGLWNRRRMQELLAGEAERLTRFGHEYSVLIMDIDDFKQVNDRYGHPQGDAVLRGVAEILNRGTRTIDHVVRYGGDEMALILSETDHKGSLVLGERLREAIRETEFPVRGGESFGVTVSIGAATAPESAEDPEELIRIADQALLAAKRKGKDRIGSAGGRRSRRA